MNIIEKTYSWKNALSTRKTTSKAVLHHAESKRCTADDIHSWHLARGWSGIGYHFFIRKDGSIYRGRPENTVGAHATGHNSDSVGICFEGAYMTETMPAAQIKAGQELLAYLKKKYGFSKVQKHKEVVATSCPGTNFPFDEIVLGASGSSAASSSGSSSGSIVSSGLPDLSKYTGSSIVDGLKSVGYDSGLSSRKALAAKVGISGYTGTAAQNTKLLNALKGNSSGATTPAAAKSAGGYTVGNTYTVIAAKGVNVRKTASTSGTKTGALPKGTKVKVTDIVVSGKYTWLKYSGGYVCAVEGTSVYIK